MEIFGPSLQQQCEEFQESKKRKDQDQDQEQQQKQEQMPPPRTAAGSSSARAPPAPTKSRFEKFAAGSSAPSSPAPELRLEDCTTRDRPEKKQKMIEKNFATDKCCLDCLFPQCKC